MVIEGRRAWVQAALGGDLDSFGRLCGHYYRPLVALAYGVLGDHQLAEDAAQEAFARALVSLGRLKRPEKFGAWLGQICRHVAIDMARQQRRQSGGDGDVVRNTARDSAALEAVRQAIDCLPAAMKEVVILRYYDNCSYEQIANVLGLSRTTVNGRLTRAKRKLAKQLRHQGVWENQP